LADDGSLRDGKYDWVEFNRLGPTFVFTLFRTYLVSRCISVSIVSDYGLDDRAIEVRSPAEAIEFFL